MQVNKNSDSIYKKDLFDITSTRELLVAFLLCGGFVTVVSVAPALIATAVPMAAAYKSRNKKKFYNTFSYARRKGYIQTKSQHGEISITLTEKGKKAARRGYFKTTASKPTIPKKWDGTWRLIVFDVPTKDHVKRNALRALIKRIGARFLQQSVWVYPYDCREQIEFLKEFFEFDDSHVRFIEARDIGNDRDFRKHFKI